MHRNLPKSDVELIADLFTNDIATWWNYAFFYESKCRIVCQHTQMVYGVENILVENANNSYN